MFLIVVENSNPGYIFQINKGISVETLVVVAQIL